MLKITSSPGPAAAQWDFPLSNPKIIEGPYGACAIFGDKVRNCIIRMHVRVRFKTELPFFATKMPENA